MAFLDKYRRFRFLDFINGSYNTNFILKERFVDNFWIGKVSKNIKRFGFNFIDLDDRAIIAYRLGKKVDERIPDTKYIDFNQIESTSLFDEFLTAIRSNEALLHGRLLVNKFSGITLSAFAKFSNIEKIKNLNQALTNLAFNLWIGNYDKKDRDFVVDNNLICWSIDYNLSGPGFPTDKKFTLGAYAEPYNLEDVEDTGWAISPIFRNYIIQKNLKLDFFDKEIKQIENVANNEIKKCFKDLKFYRADSIEVINDEFIEFLTERKGKVREAIKTWCENNYPVGQRPKKK